MERLSPIRKFITSSVILSGERSKTIKMTAFLMAVYFNGMNNDEILAMTTAYLNSGKRLDLKSIPGKKIDKHSTGGVGDKVSIILAPLVASLGVVVPMISGRGLGHTGGTLDKLESIPGFQVTGPLNRFKRQLREIGVAMLGQSRSLVPADRLIYALRDVTATVDSIPLICASIMSKKIAEGIDGLVLDVKTGSGAFISQPEKAEILTRNLITVGKAYGVRVVAHLTSMDQPLGLKIGNWLEIEECMDCLHGQGPDDLRLLVLELGAEMLWSGGYCRQDRSQATPMLERALSDGRGMEKFLQMVHMQGGQKDTLLNPGKYPRARSIRRIVAERDGFVAGFSTREIGIASVLSGAGRLRAEDAVDPRAGIILFKKLGDRVKNGEALLEIHGAEESKLDQAENQVKSAIRIQSGKPVIPPLIQKRIAS